MCVWPLHLLPCMQRKIKPAQQLLPGDKSLQCLKIKKKGLTGYDLASFLPVNLFASRKVEKKKKNEQETFNTTRWCLFTNTYINRFPRVFGTKIQRTNTLKVEYAIESKFLSDQWIWGVKIRVNLLTFTDGHQAAGFHSHDSVWTTNRACAVAFKSPGPLRSSSSHSSSILTVPNDILMAINCQDVVLLVLLDLSATFDTVEQSVLLSRLS